MFLPLLYAEDKLLDCVILVVLSGQRRQRPSTVQMSTADLTGSVSTFLTPLLSPPRPPRLLPLSLRCAAVLVSVRFVFVGCSIMGGQ